MSEGGGGRAQLRIRSFTELVQGRVARDTDFPVALLQEWIDTSRR